MLQNVYYEESHVIGYKDYKSMLKQLIEDKHNKVVDPVVYRKIYFDKDIHYMQQDNEEDKDSFSIVMKNWDEQHLLLEQRSYRDGLIYEKQVPLSRKQYECLIKGEYNWITKMADPMFKAFYLQLTINQARPSCVVDYTRQAFRLNGKKEFLLFDLGIASTFKVDEKLLLSPLLKMKERLNRNQVIINYRHVPKWINTFLKIADTTKYIYQYS